MMGWEGRNLLIINETTLVIYNRVVVYIHFFRQIHTILIDLLDVRYPCHYFLFLVYTNSIKPFLLIPNLFGILFCCFSFLNFFILLIKIINKNWQNALWVFHHSSINRLINVTFSQLWKYHWATFDLVFGFFTFFSPSILCFINLPYASINFRISFWFTTVLSFLDLDWARIRHLYSDIGSGGLPSLGFGLSWPSSEINIE